MGKVITNMSMSNVQLSAPTIVAGNGVTHFRFDVLKVHGGFDTGRAAWITRAGTARRCAGSAA